MDAEHTTTGRDLSTGEYQACMREYQACMGERVHHRCDVEHGGGGQNALVTEASCRQKWPSGQGLASIPSSSQ